jgi:hypothetical protein
MAHPRKTIRVALAAQFAGKTVAGDRVYSNRSRPQSVEKLPAIGIYNVGDTLAVFDESPRRYRRRFRLAADLYVKDTGGAEIDDVLDDFAEQVEQAVFADTALGGTVDDIVPVETSEVMVSDQREQTAMLTITFEATFYQDAPEVDADSLADMTGTHVDWDIPAGEAVDAEDDITLPATT